MTKLKVSYKPQMLSPKFQGTVVELLQTKIPETWKSSQFVKEVCDPLRIKQILNSDVQQLCGKHL